MPDMIAASKVATVARSRVAEAIAKLADAAPASYSRDQFEAAKGALAVAAELLDLIAGKPIAEQDKPLTPPPFAQRTMLPGIANLAAKAAGAEPPPPPAPAPLNGPDDI